MNNKFNAINLLLASFLLVSIPVSTQAAGTPEVAVTTPHNAVKVQPLEVHYNFDGQEIALPTGSFTFAYQGTTYVPVRFVTYALQKDVQWDNKAKKLSVSEATEAQKVAIREQLMNAVPGHRAGSALKAVQVTPIQVQYSFGGVQRQVPAGQLSFIYTGTLYVPLRFVSEAVGLQMTWDAAKKQITSKSSAYVTAHPGAQNSGSGTGNTGIPDSPATPPTSGGTGASAPGGTGGGPAAGAGQGDSTYVSITSGAEAKLNELYKRSQSELLDLASQYLAATDPAEKTKLKAQGERMLDGYTQEFESIVSSTDSKLKAGGYSTDIIKQYRDRFDSEIEAGRQLAESLGG